MKHLVYGLSSILTSSEAAMAVLHYTAALSQSSRSDVVTMPAIDLNGGNTSVSLVLGPGIPVLAEDAADDLLEPAHEKFVTDLAVRTRATLANVRHHA